MRKLSSSHLEEWKIFTNEQTKISQSLDELELRQEENSGGLQAWWGKIAGLYQLDGQKDYKIDGVGRISENI